MSNGVEVGGSRSEFEISLNYMQNVEHKDYEEKIPTFYHCQRGTGPGKVKNQCYRDLSASQ